MRWYFFLALALLGLGRFALTAADCPSASSYHAHQASSDESGTTIACVVKSAGWPGKVDVAAAPLSPTVARVSPENFPNGSRALRFGPAGKSNVRSDDAHGTCRLQGDDDWLSLPSAATLQSRSIRLQI